MAGTAAGFGGLNPKWSKYIPHEPHPKQRLFLCLDDILDILYGGAAGGGKSDALLMAALQYADQPDYSGLLIRRTYPELAAPGALMDRAKDWLEPTDAAWAGAHREWRFPWQSNKLAEVKQGGVLKFGYLKHDDHQSQYKSTEYNYVGVDESTTMPLKHFQFLFSRLRRNVGSHIPTRMRSGTNPGDRGHEWAGERYHLTEELQGKPLPRGRAFIPAFLEDNPSIDLEDYERSLKELGAVEYERLRWGRWGAREQGTWFDRDMFTRVSDIELPAMTKTIRVWDLAATDEREADDPDYTVGLKAGLDEYDQMYVLDVVRFRRNPGETDRLMRQTAEADGLDVHQYAEQEPGASGKRQIAYLRRSVFGGYKFHRLRAMGDKTTRARPVAIASQEGDISVLRGEWNEKFFREAEAFPNPKVHDDQVDTFAYAHLVLHGVGGVDDSSAGWGAV